MIKTTMKAVKYGRVKRQAEKNSTFVITGNQILSVWQNEKRAKPTSTTITTSPAAVDQMVINGSQFRSI